MNRVVLLAAGVVLSGCLYEERSDWITTETVPPPALSCDDVIRMVKAGVSEGIIVSKIRTDGVVARPSVDQIAALKKEGVSDPILEALVSARVGPVAAPERVRVIRRNYYPDDLWWYDRWYYDMGWGWYYPRWHFYWYWPRPGHRHRH